MLDGGAGIILSTQGVTTQLRTLLPVLRDQPVLTAELGRRARGRVLERYTLTRNIDALEGQNQQLDKQLDDVEDRVEQIETDTNSNRNEYKGVSEELQTYNGIDLKYEDYTKLCGHISTTQSTLDNLKQEVKFKLDKVN